MPRLRPRALTTLSNTVFSGLLGVPGTSTVPTPAVSPSQYSSASTHPSATPAAEHTAANSQPIRRPDTDTTLADLSTLPPSRRKVDIAVSWGLVLLREACRNAYITFVLGQCNNCHESRKPCNNGRPCQRCIKRGLSSSCVNHRRKRRAPPLRKPSGGSVVSTSSTTSHNNLSSRPGLFPVGSVWRTSLTSIVLLQLRSSQYH